ncbi:hypothetical protein [Pseudoalteromonas xiamenensis]
MKHIIWAALAMSGLSFPTYSQQSKAFEEEWLRSKDDHYAYYTFGGGSHRVNAQLSAHNNQIDFRLIWENEEYCSDEKLQTVTKGDVVGTVIFLVNNRKVTFAISCFDKKYVNLFPYSQSDEGKKYVLHTFDRSGGKPVKFVKQNVEASDTVYMIPSKGFSAFYDELTEATKKAL